MTETLNVTNQSKTRLTDYEEMIKSCDEVKKTDPHPWRKVKFKGYVLCKQDKNDNTPTRKHHRLTADEKRGGILNVTS